MVSAYIEPRFIITNSYEELDELSRDEFSFLMRRNDRAKQIHLSDILERPLVFIVAEPGHGKTRLIDELSARTGPNTVRIDFRTKIDDRSVNDWLLAHGVSITTDTIFLDGLDEAPAKYIQSTIFSLVDFINTHSKTKFYISCRVHYFSKYQQDFTRLPKAEFLMIKSLERSRAKQLLRNLGISDATLSTLFSALRSNDNSPTVLENPRYLEMIAKEIIEGRSDPESLNRATLFESFTFGALCEEDSKDGRQLAEYKKRMLELLALTMEVAQRNQISTDDFVTFMERAASDVKLIVAQVDIENIYEHSLLVKDLDNTVRFTNREVQEYLAARYLLRMANPEYKVFSLAIEPQLRDVIPSWRNTLSYVVDELPTIARYIVNLDPNRIVLDESTALLVTGSTSGKMSHDDKSYIFDHIYEQYNDRQNFIGQELSFNLANYADDERVTVACKRLNGLRYRQDKDYPTDYLNTINLCGNLLSLARFNIVERQEVINNLIRVALKSSNTTMQINALHALTSVNERVVLEKLAVLSDSPDNSVFGYIERLACEIAPESELAIDIYAKGIKRSSYYSTREGIEGLCSPKAIGYFLDKLATDSDLIKPIIDHDRMFQEERSGFLLRIKEGWRPEWLRPLKAFILSAFTIEYGYYAERSEFVEQIIRLIAEHDPNYYTELLDRGLQDHNMLVRIDSSLAKIIKLNDVLPTINIINQLGDKGFLVFRIFDYLTVSSSNLDASVIVKEARKHIPDLFKARDKQAASFRRRNKYNSATARFNREYEIISEDKLSNALWETSAAIINDLDDTRKNKELLEYTDVQVQHIWHILRKLILDRFNPADIQLTVTKRDNSTTSYTITRTAELFERAFVFGYLTKQPEFPQYKDKLLAYFPYMHFHEKKSLFASLQLTAYDQQKILEAYKNTATDAAQYQADDFIEFVEDSRNIAAAETLRRFVLEADVREDTREYALRTVENIEPSEEFLLKVRHHFGAGSSSKNESMLRAVDNLLITNHADASAISRRFKQIKNAAFDCPPRPEGVSYSVSDIESELHDKKFAKPLMGLHEDKYLNDFLDLLDYSFEIKHKGSGWVQYAQYLWEITTQYFENTVNRHGNGGVVAAIRRVVDAYPVSVTANYLRYLNVIQAKLLDRAGSKKPYINAINIVNTMNSTDTLTITSEIELLYTVKDMVSELGRWVSQEGEKLADKGEEVEVQKLLSLQFENILVKKYGSNNVRMHIDRETQAIDGTRTDFYVYFGFYGPIIIELKLSSHSDLSGGMTSKTSFRSMGKYMKEFNASYGLLLIYRTKDATPESFSKQVELVKKAYAAITGVEVVSIGE